MGKIATPGAPAPMGGEGLPTPPHRGPGSAGVQVLTGSTG